MINQFLTTAEKDPSKIFLHYKNMICEKSNLKNIKQELLKRIYLPLYLPLLALVACFLILKSKDASEYTNFKFKLFLI